MFKNVQVFRISPEWKADPQLIEQALESHRFVDCGASQERSVGWIEPRGEKNGPLVESIGGQWILKTMVEAKILPGSVVKEELKKRIEHIETTTGRKPGRKESKDMAEDIRNGLLAKAFTKKSSSFVWIDSAAGLLIIEAGSKSKSDEVITLLVKALDGFGVNLINTAQSPAGSMSAWLINQEFPSGFTADRDCVLKAADESKSTVKYAKHALDIEEIRAHISTSGKIPAQLAMTWDSRVSFVLTDTGMIKKIEFQEIVFDGSSDTGFDADVAIVTGELRKMIPNLFDALGGEAQAGQQAGQGGSAEPTHSDEELYEQAVTVVRENQKASVSLVQRHLKVGYNQASRLMEKLEANGIVTAMQGDGSRKVTEAVAV